MEAPIRIPPLAFRLLHHIRKAYWRIAKPTTYGVKALVIHSGDVDRILLVRHSYGDQALWSLPGGGYKPARETPEQAAKRECIEELGVTLDQDVVVLEEHLTTSVGKLGYLKLVRLYAMSDDLSPNGEISEARWTSVDLADLPGKPEVSRWVHSALRAHGLAQPRPHRHLS